ncbi:MAG: FtsX-like permease family protein [bacterium]|nr:FtsX-like permease family protein [bacterium]
MKNLINLAVKNLTRHTKRTLITGIAMAFGIAMLIWMDGMLRWADNESKRNLQRYEFGNFIISTKEFKTDRKNYPLNFMMDKETIRKVIEIAEGLGCSASPRTGFISLLSFNRGFGLPYVLMAMDPEKDSRVFSLKENILTGKYPDPEDTGVLISSVCSRELNAGIGDFITIETRTRYNTYQSIDIKVTGIFNAPDPVVNRNQVFITRALADSQLQTEGTASEIVVRSPSGENEPFLSRMRQGLASAGLEKDLVIETWQDLGSDFLAISQTKRGGSRIFMLLIFIIVAVGIINTMLMAVFERVREIGMLRALGMSDREVIWSFILEAAGIGFIGSFAGVLLGIGLDAYSVYVGLDFSSLFEDMDIGYRTGSVFYNEWNPDMMLLGFIFGILCTVLVSILPARKAVKMEITDSIRYI